MFSEFQISKWNKYLSWIPAFAGMTNWQKNLSNFLLFFTFFLLPTMTFAAGGETTSIQNALGEVAALIVHFVVYIAWIIIGLMGTLLTNDFVMHPNVIPILKLLWTVLRNFVNMSFVFILLYVAFKTIFNFEGGGIGDAGKNIGKIALALVAVNFSWLFVVAIIDASSVAIHFAFSMSDMVKGGMQVNYVCDESKKTVSPNSTATAGTLQKTCPQMVYSIEYKKEPKVKNEDVISAAGEVGKSSDIRYFVFKTPYDLKGETLDKLSPERATTLAISNGIENPQATGYKCLNRERYTEFQKTQTDNKKTSAPETVYDNNCTLTQYLQDLQDAAVIHIVTKDYTASDKIGERTIVPMIAQNLLPLEEFVRKSKSANTTGTFLIEVLFSLALSIIIVIAFIALFVVLLIRVVVMWIALVASPLLVFFFFDIFGMEGMVKDNFNKFVHMAFIPAGFGVILSLLFIIVGQLGYGKTTLLAGSNGAIVLESGVFDSGQPLFMFLLSILIVVGFWMATMWALKSAPIAGGIVEKIQTGVQTGASWLAHRPLHMDWIPIAKGADGSVIKGDLASGWNKLKDTMQGDKSDSYQQLETIKRGMLTSKTIDKLKVDVHLDKEYRLEHQPDIQELQKKVASFRDENGQVLTGEKQKEAIRILSYKSRGMEAPSGTDQITKDYKIIGNALSDVAKEIGKWSESLAELNRSSSVSIQLNTSQQSALKTALYDKGFTSFDDNNALVNLFNAAKAKWSSDASNPQKLIEHLSGQKIEALKKAAKSGNSNDLT